MKKLTLQIPLGGLMLLIAAAAFAETVELVTYYPSGGSGGSDPQLRSLRVGNAYAALPTPADGVALIATALGIGLTAPNEQLEITGNFRLPATTADAGTGANPVGVIFSGANRFIHNFGSFNFFAGVDAGNLTVTGQKNTGVGVEALKLNEGTHNTAVGNAALSKNTEGNNNTAVGSEAMKQNTDGKGNTVVGKGALGGNTTGDENTAIGHNTLGGSGDGNTAVGYSALSSNSAGGNNVAMGWEAGVTATVANANTTGSNNTFIGYQAGPGTATQLTNATALGANALVSASNALVLGGTGANAVNVGIGTADPQAVLDITSEGGAVLLPRKSTTGNPAGTNGMIYYNTADKKFRAFENGAWKELTGGDWKLIYRDDFQANANGWSMTTRTTIAGATILGGYNVTAGANFNKSFDLTGIAHTQIKVELDYYAIDSWDGEWAYVSAMSNLAEPRNIWNRTINQTEAGRVNFGGSTSPIYTDGVYHAELTGTHTGNTLTVIAGSTLNQAANDESFGIDNVEVWVR